jgi:heme-degrading monooxygenase HmoA
MIAVIFEVEPNPEHVDTYFELAAELKPLVENIDGFIGIERFASVSQPSRFLSLSFWRDEAAIAEWRHQELHRQAQNRGRAELFRSYRLRIATVIRDYDANNRAQAPASTA